MSKFVPSVLGAVALVASLSVAQFAVGNSLNGKPSEIAAASQGNLVNRVAKADRPAGIKPLSGNTIITRLGSLEDTSIAVRMPAQTLLRRDGKAGGKLSRRPVACEAPASVLTDIAQQLESGRCVT